MDPAPGPVERFTTLVRGEESQAHLDELAVLVGAAFDRRVEVGAVLDEFDVLAAPMEPTFEAVMGDLFAGGRLRGNRNDYGDPRNSFVHEVLRRGIGLPITLSIVAIEVGRRLDVPIHGVGLPGHFLVGDERSGRFADPFNAGRIYAADEVEGAWRRLTGSSGTLHTAMLAPTAPRAIVVRVLNNLRHTLEQRNDELRLAVLARLRGAFPELAAERPQHARWLRRLN